MLDALKMENSNRTPFPPLFLDNKQFLLIMDTRLMDASIDSDLFWILDLFWTHFSDYGIMFLRNVLFPLFLFSHPGFPQLPQILLQTHSKPDHLPTRKDAEEDSSYSKQLLIPSLITVIFSSSRLQDPLGEEEVTRLDAQPIQPLEVFQITGS